MTDDVRERLRGLYERSANGELLALLEMSHSDATWHLTPDSEETNDLAAGRAFLEALIERTGGTYTISAHDILVTDDHAVILEEHACEVDGERTAGRSVAVYHLRDGLLHEAWVYSENPEGMFDFLKRVGLIQVEHHDHDHGHSHEGHDHGEGHSHPHEDDQN
jgi:ketosteroid isomerase-like protein